MKKRASLALLAAGKIRNSILRRLPQLADRLGPVGSTSYRLASRIANGLGGGRPVERLEALGQASVILVSLPPDRLMDVTAEFARAPMDWSGKSVILCDSDAGSRGLAALSEAGASTAWLTSVDGFDDRLFLVEGGRQAVSEARRLVKRPGVRILELQPGTSALYSAAICLATSLALPLMTACVETMRECGLAPNNALEIAEHAFTRTLRAYRKSGRKGWEGAFAASDTAAVERHLIALLDTNPLVASLYYESAILAVQLFRRDPAWLAGVARKASSASA